MRAAIIALLGFVAPIPAMADWGNDIIYFVMVDRFADGNPDNNFDVDRDNPLAFQGGDLTGLTAQLDEIADLGATAVWLTPVNQQITHNIDAEGVAFFPHHGYWTNDFNKIDRRYGTEAELKLLADRAHELGIKVILDVVYNHVGYGADWETERPDWLRTGDECGGDPVTECLAGLPDLRTELPAVREHLFAAHIGLAKRTGIDGFRLDTVKHIDHIFWQDHAERVRAELGPDFLLLGEVWDADKYLARSYFEAHEMDAMFDFGFRDRTLKFLQGIESAERYSRYFLKRHEVPRGTYLAPFLSNHDMPMMLALLRGDKGKLRLGLALLFTSQGIPVLSWGEEIGRRGGVWPDNRGVMAWGDQDVAPGAGKARDEELRADVKQLIALRRAHPELSGDETTIVHASDGQLVYLRGEKLLIVLNRDGAPDAFTFPDGDWALLWETSGSNEGSARAAVYQMQ